MIKHIIREVAPENCDFSFYFDNDGLSERGGDYCYTLFIVPTRNTRGFNEDEWENVTQKASDILDGFCDVRDGVVDYDGKRITYKSVMEDYGIPYTSRKCHALKEWALDNDDRFNVETADSIAAFLTIVTGKKWDTDCAYGYCQGDYCEMVYCPEHYKDGVTHYGEVWLGAAKEFCVIDVEEDEDGDEEEVDSVYGFIVADCQANSDEDYKRIVCEWDGLDESETRLEMIDDCVVRRHYSYRAV